MNKINAEHLSRRAYVYVRQSTPDQVQHNLESQRRQYALVERARQLGWEHVEVIDDDLGRSGSGTLRPGFERLLGLLCDGEVGAVLSIEASRLARNGRDWHTLLEFCSVVGALLIDAEGIYEIAKTDSDPAVRKKAITNLGLFGGSAGTGMLVNLYSSPIDTQSKKEVINAMFLHGAAKDMVALARKETNPELKSAWLQKLSLMHSPEITDYMMEILNK